MHYVKRKNVFWLLFFAIFLGVAPAYSQERAIEEVKIIANNFLKVVDDSSANRTDIHSKSQIQLMPIKRGNTTYMYVVNTEEDGWVIVSNEKQYHTIIGYSKSSKFDNDTTEMPGALKLLLTHHMNMIDSLRQDGYDLFYSRTSSRHRNPVTYNIGDTLLYKNGGYNCWKQIKNNSTDSIDCSRVYNKFCPDFYSCHCGRTYAGCSAIAMAQIMWYWQWPDYAIIKEGIYSSGITYGSSSKHYYMGNTRIASRIGNNGDLQAQYTQSDSIAASISKSRSYAETLIGNVEEFEDPYVPLYLLSGNASPAHYFNCTFYLKINISTTILQNHLLPVISGDIQNIVNPLSPACYYYHSDHLGSATWITDSSHDVVQYLHYLPYGEIWRNQQSVGYDERFKFTGKERDSETGYDYFGKRYYDSRALTSWLSVDPLADKYPNISSYAYCAWNPIKLYDPDGKDPRTGRMGYMENGRWVTAQSTTFSPERTSFSSQKLPQYAYIDRIMQTSINNQGVIRPTYSKESYLQNFSDFERGMMTSPVIQGVAAGGLIGTSVPLLTSTITDVSTYAITTLYPVFESSAALQISAGALEGVVKYKLSGTDNTPYMYDSPFFKIGSDATNVLINIINDINTDKKYEHPTKNNIQTTKDF